MFINELSPIFQQLTKHPVSFMGGFVSGVLRLNLKDDPVKTWLEQQIKTPGHPSPSSEAHNGKATRPQQISID